MLEDLLDLDVNNIVPLKLLHQLEEEPEDVVTFEELLDYVEMVHNVSETDKEFEVPLGESGDLPVVAGWEEGGLESGEFLKDLLAEFFDEERGHVDMVADVFHHHRDQALVVRVPFILIIESNLHNLEDLRGEPP